MANLLMESFQTVKNPINITSFKPVLEKFSTYTFKDNGRDGNRFLGFYSMKQVEAFLISGNKAAGLYMGFRYYSGLVQTNNGFSNIVIGNDMITNTLGFGQKKLNVNEQPAIFLQDRSYFIELGMDETSFEVRINGQTYFQSAETAGIPDFIKFVNPTVNKYNEFGITDFYLNDNTGNVNNSFLGDVKIDAFPITANGTIAHGFSAHNGDSLFEAVKHYPLSDNYGKNWINSSGPGDQATFALADMAEGFNPLAVKVVSHSEKQPGSSTNEIIFLAKTGDQLAKSDVAQLSPTNNDDMVSKIFNQSPAGRQWTKADFDTLEIGMEIAG